LIPNVIDDEEDLVVFRNKVRSIVSDISDPDNFKLKDINAFHNKLSTLKSYISRGYKLVRKGSYISVNLPIGMCLGMPFGLLAGNIAPGLAFGLPIGVIIGSVLVQKAKRDGKLI